MRSADARYIDATKKRSLLLSASHYLIPFSTGQSCWWNERRACSRTGLRTHTPKTDVKRQETCQFRMPPVPRLDWLTLARKDKSNPPILSLPHLSSVSFPVASFAVGRIGIQFTTTYQSCYSGSVLHLCLVLIYVSLSLSLLCIFSPGA